MMMPQQQSQLSLLQQQLLQNQMEQNALQNIGGLIGNALAKRSDGINDSLGNGNRYTNNGANGGAFNEQQLASLNQFVNNNLDTSQKYSNLANQKFSINGEQYVADKDGLLTKITNVQAQAGPQSQSVNSTPLNIDIQQQEVGKGLTSLIPGYTDNPASSVNSNDVSFVPSGAASIGLKAENLGSQVNVTEDILQALKDKQKGVE